MPECGELHGPECTCDAYRQGNSHNTDCPRRGVEAAWLQGYLHAQAERAARPQPFGDLAVHLHQKGVGCDGHRGDDEDQTAGMHGDDAADIIDFLNGYRGTRPLAAIEAAPTPKEPTE